MIWYYSACIHLILNILFFSVETRQKSDSANSNVILMGSYSLILIAVILTLQLLCVAVDVISVTMEAGNHI